MNSLLSKFLDALRESIITQALITVAVVGAWIYLVIAGHEVPSDLTQVLMIVIGFYFGSKTGYKQGMSYMSQFVQKRKDDQSESVG